MPESLTKPLARLLYALVIVAIVYAANLSYAVYAMADNRSESFAQLRADVQELGELRAKNQQMAAYIQQVQAQAKQGAKTP